jgi:hypothetical protein
MSVDVVHGGTGSDSPGGLGLVKSDGYVRRNHCGRQTVHKFNTGVRSDVPTC